MPSIVIIIHNLRSTYNVGAILRSAEGFGVQQVYVTGYTPYPTLASDDRPPHERLKITRAIHKTALGAEELLRIEHRPAPLPLFDELRQQGYTIAALEQHPKAIVLPDYQTPDRLALILGEEVAGIEPTLLEACDVILEIPMHGRKESFNVSVAAGIALYALRG